MAEAFTIHILKFGSVTGANIWEGIKPSDYLKEIEESKCYLCHKKSGALVKLVDFGWVHNCCINWTPGIYFILENLDYVGELNENHENK